MDIDTSGRAGNGNVYIAWNDARNGDADILATTSRDGGVTWSPPLRVNDDPLNNGVDQFFPWLTVDPTGQVGVIFMDRRLDPLNNLLIDLFHTDSHNQGMGFTTNLRVTDVSHLPVVDVDPNVAPCYMSDYNFLDADASHLYATWSDNRDGDPDAYFAKIHNTQDIRINADLNFGTVCHVQSRIVQIFNTGSLDLLITSVAMALGSDLGIGVASDPITPVAVRPGEDIAFTVFCIPTFPGRKVGVVRITSDDADQATIDLVVTCTVGEPDIRVTGVPPTSAAYAPDRSPNEPSRSAT
jgi:hypothetical protein